MRKNELNIPTSKFITNLLDFVKINLTSKIEVEYVRMIVDNVLDRLKQTADIMSDNNPDNSAQLKVLWGSFGADPVIAQSVKLALFDAIGKIEDNNVREGLSLIVSPLVDTLTAMSDTDTNNGVQLEKIWMDFVKSEPFLDFAERHMEVILKRIIKNDQIAELVTMLIRFLVTKQN